LAIFLYDISFSYITFYRIIDEEEIDEPVKNLSILEINKKIKELEQDPDIDVGIKH